MTLRFFGRYREIAGTGQQVVKVPDNITGLDTLLGYLQQAFPEWRQVLAAKDKLIAVNREIAAVDCQLEAGDEVAFLPPVTGG